MANIDTQKELNKLLQEQNKLLEVQAKLQKGHLATMKALVDSMKKLPQEDLSKSYKEMNDAVKDAEEAVDSLGKTSQNAMGNMAAAAIAGAQSTNDLHKAFGGLIKNATGIAAVRAAWVGFTDGLQATKSLMSGLLNTSFTLIGTLWDLGAAIVSIPFKILNSLMDYAANISGAEFRRQMEETRKVLGSLSDNEGRAVIKTFRSMRGQLENTGLSTWRVLGNMAERLQFVRETLVATGQQMNLFMHEFMTGGEAIAVFRKGLGLMAEEDFMAFSKAARAAGLSLQEMGTNFTTMAENMGDQFGINSKLISRDMAKMAGDFENFGSLGTREMAQVAVFTRKLGLEVKDLLGLVDQFDNFENAAKSAAQLSQAFGIQIDTLGMLKEQDPAARFEKLRRAFLATGKSVESLSRQELKLLSQQSGLSAEALKLGFAQGNQAMSYEDVQKAGKGAEEQQLSQAEAMQKLSKSIELLVKEGHKMKGGFIDIFLQGFGLGIERSSEFRQAIWTLRRAMRSTWQMGRQVGQMFVDMFPGIRDVFGGITDLFRGLGGFKRTENGMVFTGIFAEIVQNFRNLFNLLAGGSSDLAMSNFIDNMQKTFFDYFNSSSPAGMRILNGFKSFFKAVGGIFKFFVKFAMQGLKDGLNLIADLIKDPSEVFGRAEATGNAFVGFFREIFDDKFINTVVNDLWPPLKEAFVKLWGVVADKFGQVAGSVFDEYIKPHSFKIGAAMAGVLFGPAVFGGIASAGTTLLLGGMAKLVNGVLTKHSDKLSGLITPGANSLIQSISKAAGANIKPDATKGLGEATKGITGAATATKAFTAKDFVSLNLKFLAMGTALSVGAVAVAAGILAVDEILKSGGITSVEKAAAPLSIIAASAIGMIPVAGAMKMLEAVQMSPALIGKVAVGIGALFTAASAMAANFVLIDLILSNVNENNVGKNIKIMSAMGLMYLETMGILAGSLVVGLAALNPVTGIALAAGAGILAAAVTALAGHAIVIMEMLNSVKVSPGFENKVEAFGKIISAIGSLAGVAVDVLEASRPSFGGLLDFFRGKSPAEEMQKNLGLVESLIYSIGEIARDIVLAISASVAGVSQQQLNSGKMVASILTSISELAKALIPSPELTGGFLSRLVDPNVLGKTSAYIATVADIMIGPDGLLNKTKDFMSSLVEMPDIDSGKLGSFSSFMQGIGGLLQALMPSGAVANLIKTSAEEKGGFLGIYRDFAHELSAGAIDKATGPSAIFKLLGDFAVGMVKAISGPGFSAIKSMMLKIVESTKGLNPDQATLGMSLFGKVVESVSTFAGILQNPDLASLAQGTIPNAGDMLTNLSQFILKPMAQQLPAIGKDFENIANAAGDVKTTYIDKTAKTVSDMITEVNSISKQLNSLEVPTLKTQLKQTADKLGLKGTDEFKIKMNDITMNVSFEVKLDADDFEKALINRPGKSKFAIKGDREGGGS